jgi:hypothetical protein
LTPMEMRLENERLRMTVAELWKSDNVVKKVLDILDNIMQQYDDSFIKSHDITERVKLFNKWKALKDFREELEKILEEG